MRRQDHVRDALQLCSRKEQKAQRMSTAALSECRQGWSCLKDEGLHTQSRVAVLKTAVKVRASKMHIDGFFVGTNYQRPASDKMMLQSWAQADSAQAPAQSPQRAMASAGRDNEETEHSEMHACQEAVAVGFRLGRVDVDRRARHAAALDGLCQRGQVHHLPPAGVDQVAAGRRQHTPQPLSQRQLTGGPALPDIPLITQAQYIPPDHGVGSFTSATCHQAGRCAPI